MKIFLSWSGGLSHEVAKALDGWLPQVMNALHPWLSSQDIEKGARWFEEIGETLSKTDFGILCLTQTNITAPWILFEAGALSKSLGQARVCPLLVNIKNADLQGPLAQFNTTGISREEIRRLIETLNARLPDELRRSESQLDEAFQVWWPRLEAKLAEALQDSSKEEAAHPKVPKRSIEDVLDEILELTRQTAHEVGRSSIIPTQSIFELLSDQPQRSTSSPPPKGSVSEFALELNRPAETLMEQLAAAGVSKSSSNDRLTEQDKEKLLSYLRNQHGSAGANRKKIILTRKHR
jgi:DNA-binding transcriptional MerR regulator